MTKRIRDKKKSQLSSEGPDRGVSTVPLYLCRSERSRGSIQRRGVAQQRPRWEDLRLRRRKARQLRGSRSVLVVTSVEAHPRRCSRMTPDRRLASESREVRFGLL